MANLIHGKQLKQNTLKENLLLVTGTTASDGQLLAYDSSNGGFAWVDNLGGVSSLVTGSATTINNISGSTFQVNVNTDNQSIFIDGSNQLTLGDPTTGVISGGPYTFADSVTINANLTVLGTATTLNTEELYVEDNIITLNSTFTAGTPTLNAGIEILRGDEATVQFRWNENNEWWEVSNPDGSGTNYNPLLTTASLSSSTSALTIQTGVGSDADILFLDIDESNLSNIPNSALTNSTINVNLGEGLTGDTSVNLGGTLDIGVNSDYDSFVTAATYNAVTGDIDFTGRGQRWGDFSLELSGLIESVSANTFLNGGSITYDGAGEGTLDLTRNDGQTVTVTGITDYYLTGGTLNAVTDELILSLNNGTNVTVGLTGVTGYWTAGTGTNAIAVKNFGAVDTSGLNSLNAGIGGSTSGAGSAVIGGNLNVASGSLASVMGGNNNSATTANTTVVGGNNNSANGSNSSVVGGDSNVAKGAESSVIGGQANTASNTSSSTIGGKANIASGAMASVVGGNSNTAEASDSFIGGGDSNDINSSASDSGIIGGSQNTIDSILSFIGGGSDHLINSSTNSSIILGGNEHTISDGIGQAILGGSENIIGGEGSTRSAIIAGLENENIGQDSAIIGGQNNRINGNTNNSVILGGQNITATTDNHVYTPYLTITSADTASSNFDLLVRDITSGEVKILNAASGLTDTYVTGGTLNNGVVTLEFNESAPDVTISGFVDTVTVNGPLTGGTIVDGEVEIGLDYTQIQLAVQTTDDKNLAVSADTTGTAANTGIAISNTPTNDAYVKVEVNGVGYHVADDNSERTTADCYFSGDGGTTARNIEDIVAGDVLYWNNNSSFDLETTDRVDLFYQVLQ